MTFLVPEYFKSISPAVLYAVNFFIQRLLFIRFAKERKISRRNEKYICNQLAVSKNWVWLSDLPNSIQRRSSNRDAYLIRYFLNLVRATMKPKCHRIAAKDVLPIS